MLPADTTASALPSATARTALTIDESGLARTASDGFSAIPIAVGATTSCEPARVEAFGPVQGHLDAVRSRSERAGDDLLRRAIPAQRVDRDAGHFVPSAAEAERLDLAALVGAAGRADAVRELRRAALRAGVDPRRLERMRRPALVATGLGGLSLRDGHRSGEQRS